MKRSLAFIAAAVLLTACADSSSSSETSASSGTQQTVSSSAATAASSLQQQTDTAAPQKQASFTMRIGETKLDVHWEDNESVTALGELAKNEPLTVQMSKYGGFEQVGSLGSELPSDDVQTQTRPGDIVLYSGSKIVVFYGSNSWDYTRLGRINGKSADELTELLGGDDITLTLSYQ